MKKTTKLVEINLDELGEKKQKALHKSYGEEKATELHTAGQSNSE